MQRRTVLVGGAFALTMVGTGISSVLAGEELEDAIDALPAPATIDGDYALVHHVVPEDIEDPADAGHLIRMVESAGIEPAAVETMLGASVPDAGLELVVLRGSFDAVTDHEERDDGWRVGAPDDGRATVASRDGLAIVAFHGDEDVRADAIDEVIDCIAGDVDAIGAVDGEAARLYELVADESFAIVYLDIDFLGVDVDGEIDRLGLGAAAFPGERTGTVEDRVVVTPPDADRETVADVLEDLQRGALVDYDERESDGILVLDATFELSPRRDRSVTPAARFDVATDPDAGTVTMTHLGGDELDADHLELWIDGELADEQPADTVDALGPGDALELEPGPIASIYLRWIDEEVGVYRDYVNEVIGGDAIEPGYDPASETVTFTYTAAEPADADRIVVDAQHGELAELPDTLTDGDAIEVADVPLESFVALVLDIEGDTAAGVRPTDRLVTYRPTPPFARVTRRPEAPPVLHLSGQHAFDADAFTITYDGDAVDDQPADGTDELAPGDRYELPEAAFGTRIELTWTAPPEPVTVVDYVVTPELQAALAYDAAAGKLAVRHEYGEAVPAEELELIDEGEPTADQPDDDHDTFEEGDAVRVAVDPFRQVELVWTDGDERERLAATATGANAFDATYSYEDERLTITYVGEVEADPTRLVLEHRGLDRRDGPHRPFADDHDVLEAGDEIVLENVAYDDYVMLRLDADAIGDRVRGRALWEYRPLPRHAVTIRELDAGVEIGYRGETTRDPAAFEIAVDGEPTAIQFTDEVDELTQDAAVTIEDVDVGSEITVAWTVPDDPVDVTSHVVMPDAEFAFALDDGILTVEHAGGDPIGDGRLEIVVEYPEFERRSWEAEEVTEGDTKTIEVGDLQAFVVVLFDGDVLAHDMVEAR